MSAILQFYLLSVFIVVWVTAYDKSDIISARIETCRGCSLNRLPEVKSFVMDDAPFYYKLDVRFVSGAPPELIFYGDGDKELERIGLSSFSRQECNELLLNAGFVKKSKKEEF